VPIQRFDFAFDDRYRLPLRLLGIRPETAVVTVDDQRLRARFGLWMLDTPLSNIDGVTVTGPYTAIRVIGPHLSLADRGVTFGTNAEAGVCVTFTEPVGALAGRHLLEHPGLTVTVADVQGLASLLRVRALGEG